MKIILLTKAYGTYRGQLLKSIRSEISSMIDELDASLVNIGTDKKDRIVVNIKGEDEEFIANALAKEYGKPLLSEQLRPNTSHSGFLVDTGKVGYGLYVDIGVIDYPKMDALVPLHKLREQFNQSGSVKTIADSFVLVDYLRVEVRLNNIDLYNNRVEAEFNQSLINRLNEWLHDDHERLLVFGANYRHIESSLEKTGHREDIYEIEKLGKFEFSLRCKRSTRASGILAAIGPRLRGVPMHLFIPKELRAMQNAKA